MRGRLQKEFGLANRHEVPRLEKVVLNVGMGEGAKNPKALEAAAAELATITGQHPVITRAKKAISNFSLRAGVPIGCAVTLRGARMYEFLDRFITLAVPRIRDFRGLPKKLDGRGNYNLGLAEQTVFPEIDPTEAPQGLNISISISGGDDAGGVAFLEELGFPFARPEEKARG